MMLEIATVIMCITFGMALYYMIKGFTSKKNSEEITINDDEIVIEKVNESVFKVDTESEEELQLLASAIETVVENIVEESNEIKDRCVSGTIETLDSEVKEIPTILNETIEIENSVNPEVEYRSDNYSIIDSSVTYWIEGDENRETMNHHIQGVFVTNDKAGIDYNTMNVHLVILNKETKDEVINVIQSYYNVTEADSEYYFGFNEISEYNEDEYTFRCSITGYYDNVEHENNLAIKADLRK